MLEKQYDEENGKHELTTFIAGETGNVTGALQTIVQHTHNSTRIPKGWRVNGHHMHILTFKQAERITEKLSKNRKTRYGFQVLHT